MMTVIPLDIPVLDVSLFFYFHLLKTGKVWVTLLNFFQSFNGVGYDVSFRTFILCIFKFGGLRIVDCSFRYIDVSLFDVE